MKPIQFKGVQYNTPETGIEELIYTVDGGLLHDLIHGAKIIGFRRNLHTGDKWIDLANGEKAPKFFQDLCNVTANKFIEIRNRKAEAAAAMAGEGE